MWYNSVFMDSENKEAIVGALGVRQGEQITLSVNQSGIKYYQSIEVKI